MTTQRPRAGWLVPILVLLMTASACGSSNDPPRRREVRFTGEPGDDFLELQERYEPVTRYLSERLGVDFRYMPATDIEEVVGAFQRDEIQLVWLSGVAGARAHLFVDGAQAIAQGALDPTGHSYFIAHVDTGLPRSRIFPQGLRGTHFTFGPRASTSGHLMPEHFLRRFTGNNGRRFFGSPDHFAESGAQVAKLVEEARFQTGVLDYRTYDRMVEEGKLDSNRCRVVWVTPDYSDAHWLAHPSLEALGPDFIEQLQEALVMIDDPGLLQALGRPEGLIPASNSDAEALLETTIELELVY